MADNVGITPGTGATAAADDIGGVLYQRVKITTGTDGVADGDVSSANPMPVKIPGVTSDAPLPVRLDQGPEGIISSNGSLQVDATQVNEQSAESLNAPNFALLGDEPVQMVGLHPSYPLPIDTATPMPIAGCDATGAQRQVLTNNDGAVRVLNQDSGPFYVAPDRGAASNAFGPIFSVEGYSAIAVFVVTAGANINILQSIDGVRFGGATSAMVNSAGLFGMGANGGASTGEVSVIPVSGRYARIFFQGTITGQPLVLVWLKSGPSIYSFSSTDTSINRINGVGVTTASAQLGVNAFGPTAPGAAHSTNNPVQMSGSDGTNVRRILTDTSGNTRVVGPLAAGTSLIGATNAAFAPELMGITDLEGRVQRATGDVRGRLAATLPDATAADDGIIDALNNVVRELKLLNAKITDLPYWLGINSVMPDDGQTFRDDPTLFNQ